MNVSLAFKNPSAYLPVAMSVAALIVLLGSIAIIGMPPRADEGAIAHIWQLLMAGQIPVILFFAIKWLRRIARSGFVVLAIQAAAFFLAVLPVYLLKL